MQEQILIYEVTLSNGKKHEVGFKQKDNLAVKQWLGMIKQKDNLAVKQWLGMIKQKEGFISVGNNKIINLDYVVEFELKENKDDE